MSDAQELFDALEAANLNGESGVPMPYSGRGMYGKRCIGVFFEYGGEWELCRALAKRLSPDAFDALPSPNTDSLGRGIILYWPRMEWDESWPDPENEYD